MNLYEQALNIFRAEGTKLDEANVLQILHIQLFKVGDSLLPGYAKLCPSRVGAAHEHIDLCAAAFIFNTRSAKRLFAWVKGNSR